MSEIFDFRDLFHAVYELADKIFPEFEFKKRGHHWVSGNGRKIDGSEGEKGKVYYYEDRPHRFKDVTRPCPGAITTYLQDQGKCSSYLDAIKYLARETGVPLPNHNLSDEDVERINKKEKQAELYEVINDFFITSLLEERGRDADAIRKNLNEERGYADYLPKAHDEIHTNNKMELGFYPSREKLKDYLKSRDIETEIIDSLFIKDAGCFHMMSCGTTHQLTIPYRNHSGRIIGFIFRNINYKKGDTIQKYLCSYGLSRKETLFKLTKTKELILIEGYLDVMLLKVLGVDDVAALGGVGLNADQVKLAKQMGAESITLWLDRDSTGAKSTDGAIEIINKSDTGIKTYVVEIPDDYKKKNSVELIKDPDELIRDHGVGAYHEVIKTARPWYIYQSEKIISQLTQTFADKERDHLLATLSIIGSKINNPIDSEAYKKHLESNAKKTGVSGEAIKMAIDNIKREADKERQNEALKKKLDAAQSHMKLGNIDQALAEIKNIERQFSANESKIDYDSLIVPDNEEEIIKALKNKPDSIYSGYSIKDPHTNITHRINIPAGAITTVAAATGHGKTAMLVNLALNFVDEMPKGKTVYFFTFEEAKHALYPKILNTYINEHLDSDNRAFIERMLKSDDPYSNRKLSVFRENYRKEIMEPRKLKINDVSFSANELIKAIYHAYEYGNAGAIFIDYIQLLQIDNDKGFNNRQEEVKHLCQELHKCAKKTGLPIIVAAQFNREVQEESDLHSTKIREAGDIEHVTSLMLGLWNKAKKSGKEEIEKFVPEPYIYMRILKQREGLSDIGEVFSFNGNTGKITDNSVSDSKKLHSVGKY